MLTSDELFEQFSAILNAMQSGKTTVSKAHNEFLSLDLAARRAGLPFVPPSIEALEAQVANMLRQLSGAARGSDASEEESEEVSEMFVPDFSGSSEGD